MFTKMRMNHAKFHSLVIITEVVEILEKEKQEEENLYRSLYNLI
jgi:hypothetical protein